MVGVLLACCWLVEVPFVLGPHWWLPATCRPAVLYGRFWVHCLVLDRMCQGGDHHRARVFVGAPSPSCDLLCFAFRIAGTSGFPCNRGALPAPTTRPSIELSDTPEQPRGAPSGRACRLTVRVLRVGGFLPQASAPPIRLRIQDGSKCTGVIEVLPVCVRFVVAAGLARAITRARERRPGLPLRHRHGAVAQRSSADPRRQLPSVVLGDAV